MAEEISEVEMLAKKGDVVIDVQHLMTISSNKNRHDAAGSSKMSNVHGVSNGDPVQILAQELDALPGQSHVTRPVTIFRVPIYRKSVKDMVEPKMVSIGPYHHGKESLRTMEKHKRWYLRDFLARKPEIGMGVYLEAMRAMEMQARQCYDDVVDISEMSKDEFALMLLLDGCFILEYFLKEKSEPDYVTNVGWDTISWDLLRIENQIPYSVIHKLGTIYYGTVDQNCEDECLLRRLVYERRLYNNIGKQKLSCNNIQHLLHFNHLCFTPSTNKQFYNGYNYLSFLGRGINSYFGLLLVLCLFWIRSMLGLHREVDMYRIPSATKLQAAGVTFKGDKKSGDKFEITFKNGVLVIPFMDIDERLKIFLTNVLLYEQSQGNRIPKTLTSYLMLMDFLIDTGDDVAILTHCGAIGNLLPNDEEVALFFNHLCEYTIIGEQENHYAILCKDVLEYINQPWHRYRAMLVRDYFSNPWAIISFLAAIILLLLTATQTGFSIYPVVHPK